MTEAKKAEKTKTIAMSMFRKQPGEWLLDVRRDGWTIVLTQYGRPVAKIVPVAGAGAGSRSDGVTS